MKILKNERRLRRIVEQRWLTGGRCPHFPDRWRYPLHCIDLSTMLPQLFSLLQLLYFLYYFLFFIILFSLLQLPKCMKGRPLRRDRMNRMRMNFHGGTDRLTMRSSPLVLVSNLRTSSYGF